MGPMADWESLDLSMIDGGGAAWELCAEQSVAEHPRAGHVAALVGSR